MTKKGLLSVHTIISRSSYYAALVLDASVEEARVGGTYHFHLWTLHP